MFGRKSRNNPGKCTRWNIGVCSISGILDFSENKKTYRALLLDSNSSMWTVNRRRRYTVTIGLIGSIELIS